MKNTLIKNLKFNWKSGLSVALVAIPLSISLAVAAGASPTQGIITAFWAGLIGALFGGSDFNIIGPTGALSGLIASFIFIYGSDKLALLTILSGLIILIFWFFKLERYLIYIPASAIHGFTLGVALIIGLSQINFALGLNDIPKHETFFANLLESLKHINETSLAPAITFLVFLILIFTIDKLIKNTKSLPKIPATVLLAPPGIILGYLAQSGKIALVLKTLGMQYSDVSAKFFTPISFNFHINQPMVIMAATIALIAMLETMLSAKIADGMTKTKHNKRREMLGLGLANIASGLTGGIPATAALARTALNIKSGARNKTSAALSALFVGLISFFLLTTFKYLPLSVIAAILVGVAVRMIEQEHFKRMWTIDKKSFVISLIVAVITIYHDPIFGILIGSIISLLMFLDVISRGQFELVINDTNKKIVKKLSGNKIDKITENSHTLVYSIKGILTYINSQAHISRFEQDLNGYENIIIRLRGLHFMDIDGIDAFDEIISIIQKRKKKVYVSGVTDFIDQQLQNSAKFKELKKSGCVYDRTSETLDRLGFDLSQV